MKKETSWQDVGEWYHRLVDEEGSYYHKEVILPKLLSLFHFDNKSALLDIGCGQGVLERALPYELPYCGVDLSSTLIKKAKAMATSFHHQFLVADATKPLSLSRKFSHACIILALQNMSKPQDVLQNISIHMEMEGKLFLVLNHPCFRMLKHSSWGVDQNVQYRRLDRYLSSYQVDIPAHPSRRDSPKTKSFHFSLSTMCHFLKESGFVITDMTELCSNKKSYGKMARAEN